MAVTVECVWYPRVWPWPFDVIGTHEVLVMPVGYGLCQRVCMWQLRVFGAPLYVGGSWNSWVARCDWQVNVVGAHVCGHGNWI